MKWFGSLFAVVLATAVPASAAPISAYEGFSYSLGGLSGANGGTGWTTAWSVESTAYFSSTIVAPGTALGYLNTSSGISIDGGDRALEISTVQDSAFRNVALRGYDPSTAGGDPAADQYYSFLIRPVSGLSDSGPSGDSARVLTFDTYMGTGIGSAAEFVGRDGGTTGFTNGGAGSSAPTSGETFFMAFRISPTDANGAAWRDLTVWANPTSSVEYDGAADFRLATTVPASGTPDQIILRLGNLEAGDAFLIDEIRVGSSYADVVPSSHSGTVAYREVFPGDGSTAPTLTELGWKAHWSSSATPSGSVAGVNEEGARAMPAVNSLPQASTSDIGYLQKTTSSDSNFFYWTDEFGMNNVDDVGAIRWSQRNAMTIDEFRAAIRLDVNGTSHTTDDDVWLATANPFANHTSVATEVNSLGHVWQQNQLVLQNADWQELSFTPGSQMALGSATTLPAGVAVTGFGLYADTGEVRGDHRIDNVEVDTSPFEWTVAQTVLVDFNDRLNPGSPWNVIHAGNETAWNDLLNTHGDDSSIDIRVSADLLDAASTGWDDANPQPAWSVDNAAEDYSYYQGDDALDLELAGLNPGNRYDFEILAARDYAGRIQDFEVTGASTMTFQFDPEADGYDLGNWIVLSGIAPDASGRIILSMTKTDNSVCINAMRIEELVPEPSSLLLLGAALLVCGFRRRQRSCGKGIRS